MLILGKAFAAVHKIDKKILLGLFIMVLLFFLLILLSIGKTGFNDTQMVMVEQEDYLVYVITEHPGERKLMFYDPAKDIHTPILRDWDIDTISFSVNNLLAFSSTHEGDSEIYILDYPFADNTPINITNKSPSEDYVLSWSLDGSYLAYESLHDGGKTLSIWDGNDVSHIYHYQKQISEITWSPDAQLAFTEFYSFSSNDGGDPSEIFIWDGDITVSLSQNPSGEDRFPAWNADGQLAFLSEREGEYDIFVWDGVSKINGIPDVSTFVNIAPRLTEYYSDPVWTNSGSITFGANEIGDTHAQIYEWDGKMAINISQNPGLHNGGQRWRSDGYWSFITYFSSQQLIYIRNEKNQTVLTTEGQYQPAWSQSGQLIFCHRTLSRSRWQFSMWEYPKIIKEYSGWTLSMWDGEKVVEIAQGYEIKAQWQHGAGVFCSSG
jgi:hypothetical protein